MNHIIVKWAPYAPKFKGPTQCRSCTMYGHGAENCHRPKVCVYCAATEWIAKWTPLNHLRQSTTVQYSNAQAARRKISQNKQPFPTGPHGSNIRRFVRNRTKTTNQIELKMQMSRKTMSCKIWGSLKSNITCQRKLWDQHNLTEICLH